MALVQPDLKKLVAYSSVSHMGFVTLGHLRVHTSRAMHGAILQMVNHGLITGALFLLVGVIYERTHDRTIAKMGGLAARDAGLRRDRSASSSSPRPACPACPASSASSWSSSARSRSSPWAAAVATFVMILAAAYLLWMFQRVVFGELSDFLTGLGHHLTDMTPIEVLTLAPLGALVVVFGLFPGLLLDLVAGHRHVDVLDDGRPARADRGRSARSSRSGSWPRSCSSSSPGSARRCRPARPGAPTSSRRRPGPPIDLARPRHDRPAHRGDR